MILRSLELCGFKTFPDKTKLEFGRGITAVVGPNGSGKSNISDAIRWVFGEQSTKNLRCTKMEDVIFDGTTNRKSKGFAKVSLTIDNSDRSLPFESNEVAITRRYYRSGESEYLINNANVRLKDIYELFMDTGLGKDGYSVIGQGKIDSIVSNKSSERREIFEEAAGISKFRYRKAEAQRQLEKTKDNLTRLSDIISQLEERVEPLKIQSEKAKQFTEYSNEKKDLEVGLWLETLLKSEQVLREQDNKILLARTRTNDADVKLDNIRNDLEQNFSDTNLISAKANDERKKLSEFEKYIADKTRQVSVLKNEIEHSIKNKEKAASEQDLIKNSFKINHDNIIKIDRQINAHKEEIAHFDDDLKLISDELISLDKEISGEDKIHKQLSDQILDLTNQSSDIKIKLANLKSTSDQLEIRKSNIKESISENLNKINEFKLKIDYCQSEFDKGNAGKQKLQKRVTDLRKKLDSKKQTYDDTKKQLDKLRLTIKDKSNKVKFLRDLEHNFEGFTKGVKFVMNKAYKNQLNGVYGPISRLFKVLPEYALAIEIALGSAMQNIVVESEMDAKAAILCLKQNNIGRATFLPVTSIKPRGFIKEDLSHYDGFVGIASKLCNTQDKYRDIINFLLGRTVIVSDIDKAIYIAKNLSYKFKIVTLDGQVINSGGSLTGGSISKNSGLLSRAVEIDKLSQEIEVLNEQAVTFETDFKSLDREILQLNNDLSETNDSLFNLKNKILEINTELKTFNDRLSFIDSDIQKLTLEKENILLQREEISKSINNLNVDDEKLSSKISALKTELSVSSEKQKNVFADRERKRELVQKIKFDKISKEKDVEILISKKDALSNSIDEDKIKLNSLVKEDEIYKEKIKQTESDIKIISDEINKVESLIDCCNNDIESLSQNKLALEQNNTRLRNQERDILEEREHLNRDLIRLEERAISLQKSYDEIIAKLWDEYELTRSEAETQTSPIDDLPKAKRRLSELKLKIKKLGCVNLSAIEEYKEVSERYTFMKAEFDDVENSKNQIIRHINELTKNMRSLFIEKFNEINKNFKEIFTELFLGGSADLQLTDQEDILNSGIEIKVSPPGKIVSHLELLSGGEKALVSISIYFAIMKVNPAPFCVLDEIEAALDDVNVTRFAKYLKRINDKTQFIMITHRRGSMEEADVLYGVTMQEQGVSKLLELKVSEIAGMNNNLN